MLFMGKCSKTRTHLDISPLRTAPSSSSLTISHGSHTDGTRSRSHSPDVTRAFPRGSTAGTTSTSTSRLDTISATPAPSHSRPPSAAHSQKRGARERVVVIGERQKVLVLPKYSKTERIPRNRGIPAGVISIEYPEDRNDFDKVLKRKILDENKKDSKKTFDDSPERVRINRSCSDCSLSDASEPSIQYWRSNFPAGRRQMTNWTESNAMGTSRTPDNKELDFDDLFDGKHDRMCSREVSMGVDGEEIDEDEVETKPTVGDSLLEPMAMTSSKELPTSGTPGRPTKMARFIDWCKRFVAFLCSTVGLSCLLVGYTILGGLIFKSLEAPNEVRVKHDIKDIIRLHVDWLWNVTEEMNVLHPKNWTAGAEVVLDSFTRQVYLATKVKGWDGKDGEKEKDMLWSFPGALLYSVTVITTIGYGHITPKTDLGRAATMIYAIIGIPLTLLAITNLGGFMATAFRFTYTTLCSNRLCRRTARFFHHRCCAPRQRQKAKSEKAAKDDDVTSSSGSDKVGSGKTKTKTSSSRDSSPIVTDSDDEITVGLGWRSGLRRTLRSADGSHTAISVPIHVSCLLIIGYIAIGALVFSLWEDDWDYLIGSYFCFVTLTTIGFGDYVPGTSLDAWNSHEKLIFCALYLVFGLALLAMCFDLMQEEARRKFRALGRRIGLLVKSHPDRGSNKH